MKTNTIFTRVALVMLLAVFGCLQGFSATYYAKAIAKVSSSGGGKVFVSTTNSSADAVWAESSEALRTGSTRSSSFYLFAQADEGWEFDHWATADNSNTAASRNNPWTYTFNAGTTATSEAKATTNTRYAVFKQKQPYYSTLTAYANEGGKVFVNTTNSNDDAVWEASSVANQTSEDIATPVHNYYLYAQGNEGWDFIGWSTTVNGSVINKSNPYNAKVTVDSHNEADPTAAKYYAHFAQAVNHYSQAIAKAAEGGQVFVNTTNSIEGATSTASTTTANAEVPTHTYYYFAQAAEGYEFKGWMKEGDETVVSTANPYTATVNAESVDAENPTAITYVPKFVAAVPHYSKVILKLNGNNDINNLGIKMLGGKVYVGRTAEEAESAQYEFTSELVQNTWSVDAASHDYYLYAKADEGFEYAGIGTTASATTSPGNTANPYKVTVSATSTDEAAPTEKTYYASFKYAADNKPSVCYANFTLVAMLAQDDGTGKLVNVESDEAGMLGLNYNDDASGKGAVTTEPTWHAGSSYASEAISKPYTSGTVYFPYTIFAKPNPGYEFVGWTTTSTTTNPSQKGTLVDDYSYYYSDSYTRTSVSNVNYPGSCGVEGGPKTKKYYAVFKKLEQIEEPTGETTVVVTSVTGTTELVEGSVSKNFNVDLVLNENIPYDKPGSDKNAKPNETLKQFVTVLGANGNKSEVAGYSLVSESHDLGEDKDGLSLGTAYTCNTLRLSFPYNIKADTYTVHLPYGLYTTVDGNKTPTYEFTITVTADVNPYLTLSSDEGSQFPKNDMTIKYKAASQMSTPDPDKGEYESSAITAYLKFNEVVESIDESKKAGIILKNTTEGVTYKPLSVIRNGAAFGKVSGEVSIAYPELVNGSYTLTIPEGLFVGNGKVNEAKVINFTVTGFNSVQLKPYEMVTDLIAPKANAMTEKLQQLQNITVSYKGEFGQAVAVVGNASGIKVQRYTEVISGEGENAKPVRTYYDVTTTPSVAVADGKMVISFSPVLYTGMYEVNVPAGLAANMEPGEMTMAQKMSAGYAETPAYSWSFNVETVETAQMVVTAAKYGTFVAPFEVTEIPTGVTASKVTGSQTDGTLVLEAVATIPAHTPVILQSDNEINEEVSGIAAPYNKDEAQTVGMLTGVYVPTPAPADSYVLQSNNGKVGFYHVGATIPTVGANRCYLNAPVNARLNAYFFDGATTAIDALNVEAISAEAIHSVSGVRINALKKGINIIKTANGTKKVIK